jgi:mRNA-degrading endonuclease YafQ of YafQ-DinJ toxin-antitoxin module
MDASAPPISDVVDIVSAEEVCDYTYKVELIEKDKISLVIFNTTTGIKYQTYIEEYSDVWDALKVNFQHNFPLCLKMLRKALLDKDPSFAVNVLHKIDYVVLQLTYINDLLGFTIELHVNQYKKDNLQESVNRLEYKQSLLEQENKSLKDELQSVHLEIKELKRIINLLGDGFSYDNRLSDYRPNIYDPDNDSLGVFRRGVKYDSRTNKRTGAESVYDIDWRCDNNYRFILTPQSKNPNGTGCNNSRKAEPFINVTVANKLATKLFHSIIDKHKLPYDIDTHGYQWQKLDNMMKEHGLKYSLKEYWRCIFVSSSSTDPKMKEYEAYVFEYDFTWNSFKELFDIKI